MIIDYGCGEKEIEANVWALMLYEQEFHSDLIKDVFGKQKVEEDAEGGVIEFDYTAMNWYALTKALWAMLRSADGSVPRFSEWAKTATGMNMFLVFEGVTRAVSEGFFRRGPSEAEEAEREGAQ